MRRKRGRSWWTGRACWSSFLQFCAVCTLCATRRTSKGKKTTLHVVPVAFTKATFSFSCRATRPPERTLPCPSAQSLPARKTYTQGMTPTPKQRKPSENLGTLGSRKRVGNKECAGLPRSCLRARGVASQPRPAWRSAEVQPFSHMLVDRFGVAIRTSQAWLRESLCMATTQHTTHNTQHRRPSASRRGYLLQNIAIETEECVSVRRISAVLFEGTRFCVAMNQVPHRQKNHSM